MNKVLADEGLETLPIHYCEHAQFDSTWLSMPTKQRQTHSIQLPTSSDETLNESPLPASGFLRETQNNEGWFGCGWRFDAQWQFKAEALLRWCSSHQAERIKAVMNTDKGVFVMNAVNGELTTQYVDNLLEESRIEMLFESEPDADALEQALLATRCDYSSV
jgi:hypothetical protein